MSQLTDFLFIGMIGVGGMFIFFNWDQVQGWLGGNCSGTEGPCTYDKCGQVGEHLYCHSGSGGKTCVKRLDNVSIASGCLGAKIMYCGKNPQDTATCGGGSGSDCPKDTGNCKWDCKGGYCWDSTCGGVAKTACVSGRGNNRTVGCNAARDSFIANCARYGPGTGACVPKLGTAAGCTWDCKGGYCHSGSAFVCNQGTGCRTTVFKNCVQNMPSATAAQRTAGCTAARNLFCQQHSPDHKCGPGGCPAGYVRNNGGSCSPFITPTCQPCYVKRASDGACQLDYYPGRLWIARNAVSTLGRMGAKNLPAYTSLANIYVSATTNVAKLNSCNLSKLHTLSAAFNKAYAQFMLDTGRIYKLVIVTAAFNALVAMRNDGVWRLSNWSGGVSGFYTGAGDIDPDTPAGYAYSPTLRPDGSNIYDPYGDQQYSATVQANNMRVKVSN